MLTPKQYKLLMFIDNFIKENGCCPSYEEMKEAVGIRSKSGIHALIEELTERDFIKKMPHKARAVLSDYTPMRFQTDERDFAFSHVARVSGLDLNGHFNNVAYITLGLDAFSSAELSADMLRYEIAFRAQSYEGEELRVFRRRAEDGSWLVYCDKRDGTRVFESLIRLAPRA